MAFKGIFSYWWLPVLSGFVWLGMLLGMLLYWIVDTHRERYPSIEPGMSLAYISDIGAQELKPLFIAGCVLTTVTFDLAFLAERWLRHSGRLAPNKSPREIILVALSLVFAVVGTVGLICLSIFDTVHYHTLHDVFLLLFMGGYIISAIFVCWEYQRLGIKYREYRVLRVSFWIKLTFIFVEVILIIVFGVLTFRRHQAIAAYFEWIISFVFTGYVWSFAIDLWPAVGTKDRSRRFVKGVGAAPRDLEEERSSTGSFPMTQQQPAYIPNRSAHNF